MQDLRLLLAASLLFSACSPGQRSDGTVTQKLTGSPPVPRKLDRPRLSGGLTLNGTQQRAVGMKIWQNESGGTVSGLTHWNEGEEFPSLGIGHFIWYPRGFDGRWTETWPEFIRFAQGRGVRGIPTVALLPDCPWSDRKGFRRDFNAAALSVTPRKAGMMN